MFLKENDTRWPAKDQTVYEYFVDAKAKEWVLWEKQLTTYRPPPEMPFFKIMVPTVDTLRSKNDRAHAVGHQAARADRG